MSRRSTRWTLAISAGLLVVVVGATLFRFAAASLQRQVTEALGARGETQEIRVGLTQIELVGVRIRGAREAGATPPWPAEDEFRAQRVILVPSLFDLLTGKLSLERIQVDSAYLAILRTTDGRIALLPGVLEQAPEASEGARADGGTGKARAAPPAISIGKTILTNATVEFFDATLKKSAFKLRLEKINATIGKLQLPDLQGVTSVKLDGVVKGVRQDGTLAISGSVELATRESGLTSRLAGVELAAFQPYLMKASASEVRSGTLDFELKSSVRKGRLRAPGMITLSELEFAATGKSRPAVGMARDAAIAMMKSRDGKISLRFVIDGDLNDPRFSVNEALLSGLSASFAQMRGVNADALAKEVAGISKGAPVDLGESLGRLFNK